MAINSPGSASEKSAAVPTAPARPPLRCLAELDDRALLSIARALPRASERGTAVRELLARRHELPERERTVMMLRFHGGLTQAEIGQRIGVSQMHVSRLFSHALGYLRPYLLS
jgi:RNA polymerase sigma factor (sigma-70 family)